MADRIALVLLFIIFETVASASAAGVETTTSQMQEIVYLERPGNPYGYVSDWTGDGETGLAYGPRLGQQNPARCVDIPKDMALCRNIGYAQMRLPNLFDHETVKEATSQASHWISLLNVQCHRDTQIFLCSLFAPVCLDRPIYPCRTLCEAVKKDCEGRMLKYGYAWPEMLNCDKYPSDNDLCIGVRSDMEPGI